MNMLRNATLAACMSASFALLAGGGVRAETATPSTEKPSTEKAAVTSTDKMSDADKRAKAADCSKQADVKHLHGSAREKFRETCKRK
jgi:hypothetical protein